MRGTSILGFLLTLPPLAALGHDLYVAYKENGTDIDLQEPFHLSDVGWLWQTYSGDTLRIAKTSFDPALWDGFVVPFLKMDAVIAAALPAALFFTIVITLKVMRSGTFALKMGMGGGGGGGAKPKKAGAFVTAGDKKAATVKYKRK